METTVSPDQVELRVKSLLESLQSLETVRRHRRKHEALKYYCPNSVQYKAHQSTARVICFVGGNRSGKSTFGAVELCMHATKQYPEWYPMERRYDRPLRMAVSSTEFPVIERVIEPKLREYMPPSYARFERKAHYLSRIVCKDGTTIDMLTSEMKDDAYESADWDFLWCDEPQQQSKYYAMHRGLVDRQGSMVITFTPITEPWMKEDIVDKADGKFIDVFTANIRDNKVALDGTKILSEEAIKQFEKALPEEYRQTRIHGKFFHLRGVVYKELSDAHSTNFKYQYPDPVICVLDPHDRTPHHVIWAYITRNDDVYVDYEIVTHCELDELARKILSIEHERGYAMQLRLVDPNFGRKPSLVGANKTVIQELAHHGCKFREAVDNIELGHMIVRDYLHYDSDKPMSVVNSPKLFFSRERTPITFRSMRNLQYEDWKGTAKDKDPKEREKDKGKHGADCVRYLIVEKPTHSRLLYRHDYELESNPY